MNSRAPEGSTGKADSTLSKSRTSRSRSSPTRSSGSSAGIRNRRNASPCRTDPCGQVSPGSRNGGRNPGTSCGRIGSTGLTDLPLHLEDPQGDLQHGIGVEGDGVDPLPDEEGGEV